MHNNIIIYPLGYLALRDERGRRLFWRNGFAAAILASVMSVPFALLDANFFGDGGFLDRFGSFTGVLTGFYIAALVGIASFASSVGDLDEVIEVGPIRRVALNRQDGDPPMEDLTRRQYVCSLFGYLSFVSLGLSVSAILLIVTATHVASAIRLIFSDLTAHCIHVVASWLVVGIFNLLLAHLLVTTCHGLYYLIDRLYAKRPILLPKPEGPEPQPVKALRSSRSGRH